jgi:hypothetical protein
VGDDDVKRAVREREPVRVANVKRDAVADFLVAREPARRIDQRRAVVDPRDWTREPGALGERA